MNMPWLLAIHITGGIVAILSGAVALWSGKGERLHRAFGALFVIAMLIMAGTASYMAFRLDQTGNMFAGLLVFYFVGTAWITVRRKESTIGTFEYFALVLGVIMAGLSLYGGLRDLGAPAGALGPGGVPLRTSGFASTVLGIALVIAALFDLKVIIRGGIAGAPRIARHLWRMLLAFFIASGSFFIGQMKVMPQWVLEFRPLLFALGFAPLVFLVFWLIRVRLTKWYERSAPSAKGAHA
jgi:uncharacterized membrane protein